MACAAGAQDLGVEEVGACGEESEEGEAADCAACYCARGGFGGCGRGGWGRGGGGGGGGDGEDVLLLGAGGPVALRDGEGAALVVGGDVAVRVARR